MVSNTARICLHHTSDSIDSRVLVCAQGDASRNNFALRVAGDAHALDSAQRSVERTRKQLESEFGKKEASLSVRMQEGSGNGLWDGSCSLRMEFAERLLAMLSLLPHGVLKMSHDLKGLVRLFGDASDVLRADC